MTGAPAGPTVIDLAYPFSGRWLVQNSPADRVPSHGTETFASAHAIDFVPVGEDGRSAPITGRTILRPEPHLHVQAMTQADPRAAHTVLTRLAGELPGSGQIVTVGDSGHVS